MLDRLKSLPLTIVLTILIWMYAESQVNSVEEAKLAVDNVPVWWSGPPAVLDQDDVVLEPQTVSVKLTGTRDHLDAIRQKALREDGGGIHAYLDITADDRPSDSFRHRVLRIVAPNGVTVADPPEVAFRLVERHSGSEDSRP